VALEQTFVLTLRVRFEGEAQLGSPRLPDLPGFSVLNSWTNQSSSSRLMAGPGGMQFKTERSVEFNYNLRAEKAGRQIIPPLEISVNGESFKTDSIAIQVFADASQVPFGSQGGRRGGQAQSREQEDPTGVDDLDALFNALLQRPPVTVQPRPPVVKNPNELFFLHLDVDKQEVYEGEQIIANWYIYSRGNIISLDRLKFPELKGFWREILEEIPALRFVQETLNGVPYRRALLASHALFPIRPGQATIDEYRVRATVQVPVMGAFGGFSFGQPQTFNRSSPTKTFQVKPLPLPRPKNFVGGVGQFSLRSEVALGSGTNQDESGGSLFQARMGEPFKWTLQFEGHGNAKMIELPKLDLPEGLDWVETRTESRYFKNGRSVKNFEVFLMPKKTGAISVAPFRFALFNPQTAEYYEVSTDPFSLNVEGIQSNFAQSQAPSLPQADSKVSPKITMPLPLVAGTEDWVSQALSMRFPTWLIMGLFSLSGLILSLQAVMAWTARQRPRDPVAEIRRELAKVRKLIKKSPREAAVLAVQLAYAALGLNDNTRFSADTLSAAMEKLPPSLRESSEEKLKSSFAYFEKLAFSQQDQALDSIGSSRDVLVDKLSELEEVLVQISKRLAS
jgi:hypothetical protein